MATTVSQRGKKIEVDEEGYLVNFGDWDEEVAYRLAELEGLEKLTPDKIEILKFIREYYRTYNYFPIVNAVCRNVSQPKNCVTMQFLNPLKAWKIAGLPHPDETMAHIIRDGETPT